MLVLATDGGKRVPKTVALDGMPRPSRDRRGCMGVGSEGDLCCELRGLHSESGN